MAVTARVDWSVDARLFPRNRIVVRIWSVILDDSAEGSPVYFLVVGPAGMPLERGAISGAGYIGSARTPATSAVAAGPTNCALSVPRALARCDVRILRYRGI